MKLMEAIEAMQALANMAAIDGHFDLHGMVVAEDFWTNNWEDISAAYDTPEKLDPLKIDGEFPEPDPTAIPFTGDSELAFGMKVVLQKALEQAREEHEVLVEGTPLDSMRMVSFATAFWSAYGEEICEATAEHDVSDLMDAPGI